MQTELKRTPRIALNTDTNLLKLVAIVLMVVDHVGYQLMGDNIIMRSLGRLSFPIFAWCIVVGSEYTHDIKAYMKRMALFYFVSQPCYVLAFGRAWTQHNIYLTLLLGLIAIWSIKDREYWALPITLLAAYFISQLWDERRLYNNTDVPGARFKAAGGGGVERVLRILGYGFKDCVLHRRLCSATAIAGDILTAAYNIAYT